MNISGANMADAYAVTMVKKQQDQEKEQGQAQIRLIESAGGAPYKRPPPAGSTMSVVA